MIRPPARARSSSEADQLVPEGEQGPARHRRFRRQRRRPKAALLHQHPQGLAAEHAGRLLGLRSRQGRAAEAGRQGPRSLADVRGLRSPGKARRLRPATTTCMSRTWPTGAIIPLTKDGSDTLHQRHVRLGLRGRALRSATASAGAPTASRSPTGRSTARACRSTRCSTPPPGSIPGSSRCAIPGRARRTRPPGSGVVPASGGDDAVAQDRRRPARELHRPHGVGAGVRTTWSIQRLNRRQDRLEVMLADAADRRGPHRPHRPGRGLGRCPRRPEVARSRASLHLDRRSRRLASPRSSSARATRAPRAG